MNNYEDWAQLVAKNLAHEADYIAAIEKDELDDKAATEAFSRAVLEPFLPENYGLGAGRIIDAFGNCSEFMDIIVYNRDFPRIGMRGMHNAYLYESVLTAFAIRAKFIRKTFFDALNACASMARLETNLDKTVLVKLAKKNGLRPGPNKTFIHDDPLRTGRFELIGRPPAFVFGFSGMKYSYRQLQENIELWIANRHNVGIATPMKSLPAVIATQGCFGWRNAAPLALSNREMLGIGNDDAPVRLIALQLLYLLNRRLNSTTDGYGLKPSLNAYLSQFKAPRFERGVGDIDAALKPRQAESESAVRAARDTARFEPARDHAALEAAAKAAAATSAIAKAPEQEPPRTARDTAVTAPATEPARARTAPPEPAMAATFDKPSPFASSAPTPPPEAPTAADKPAEAAVFDKPSPFTAAPTPSVQAPAAEAKPGAAAVFDKPSPFGSAPIPPAPEPDVEPARSPAPVVPLGSAPIPPKADTAETGQKPANAAVAAPLGSAPIPPMETPGSAGSQPAAAKVTPAKPPVDIDLGAGDNTAVEDKPEPEEDEFIQTVVIPPNAGARKDDKSRNSTDAFIARVKQQLSTSDAAAGKEQDFTSTIPQ